ncbi:MAG: M3 family oligoendopeptidase [Chloroflexota bacterium]|jgi:oligoendopeptidase F
MFTELKTPPPDFLDWKWDKFEPYARDLISRPLDAATVGSWLKDWSDLSDAVEEMFSRLNVAVTVNTADKIAEERFRAALDDVYPQAMAAEQKIKTRLLESGLQPDGFEIPLRNYRDDDELFRDENLPLLAEEQKLGLEYDQIAGKQTVEWQGKEITLTMLRPVYQESDRALREQAWRLSAERQLADREAFNDLWIRFFKLRQQIAANAGKSDFRAYRWVQFHRHDYSPQDCQTFREAIEQVIVPLAQRVYERRRKRLGLDALRPWDLDVDPLGLPPLRPYQQMDELKEKTTTIFRSVDPSLGEYFQRMITENLLDLENRKNKAPGGYCTSFPISRRPFIFMNAVGLHDDVQTLLHEGGHAFHVFESAALPLSQLTNVPIEFAEVASMGMEFLAGPYLSREHGGYYSSEDARRAFNEHIEQSLLFWPYMAVVDGFQHWAYTHPQQALDPSACDQAWDSLWQRFMIGMDWSGLEEARRTGWQRKLHIFQIPFYYVEYGLAQLGAAQVWRNAQADQRQAVAAYRHALALGGSVGLPQLFQAAGARFVFDAPAVKAVVERMAERVLD